MNTRTGSLLALWSGIGFGLLSGCVDVLGIDNLEVRAEVVYGSPDAGDGEAGDGAPGEGPESRACVVSVVAGAHHTCARTVNGSTWCWGDNLYRQLGVGGLPMSSVPVKVLGLPADPQEMIAAFNRTCIETEQGGVMCWGDDFFGQSSGLLGEGTTPPVEVPRMAKDVRQIALGANHTCVRKIDSSIWCWGDNGQGQTGDPEAESPVLEPVQALGPGAPLLVAAGDAHTCVSLGKQIKCWGANDRSQCGVPSTLTVGVPTVVQGWDESSFATGLSLGRGFSCALSNSRVFCWGVNTQAQSGMLGVGLQVDAPLPRADSLGVLRLHTGVDFGCVEALGLFCWGRNDKGQCGDPTVGTRVEEPVVVPALPVELGSVALGEKHACVVTDNYRVVCWGANDRGQLGLGDEADPDAVYPPTEVPVPCEG